MKKSKSIVKQLGHISNELNGICGRIIVASMSRPEVKEAHKMAINLGAYVDDLINAYMTDGDGEAAQ